MSRSGPLTDYEKYIRTEELLSLQKPAAQLTCHDELQFQMVHQVAELWMKLLEHEALYAAVLERGVAPVIALLDATGPGRPAGGPLTRADVDRVLDLMLDYLDAHPHLPRLIQRAGLEHNRALRTTFGRLLRPLWAQGLRVLGGASAPWTPAELPHLAAGLYHLIFGYFASAPLLETVGQEDLRGPEAVARQRTFLKAAVAQLLGVAPVRAVPRSTRRTS